MRITVEGKKYRVVENLGFIHSCGLYGKVCIPVDIFSAHEGERIAVKEFGKWRWWTAQDRVGRKLK